MKSEKNYASHWRMKYLSKSKIEFIYDLLLFLIIFTIIIFFFSEEVDPLVVNAYYDPYANLMGKIEL